MFSGPAASCAARAEAAMGVASKSRRVIFIVCQLITAIVGGGLVSANRAERSSPALPQSERELLSSVRELPQPASGRPALSQSAFRNWRQIVAHRRLGFPRG